MLGVLIIASGVGQAFEGSWPTLTIGYVVMRVGLVASWLLTARNAPAVRATALTYGIGILIAQIYWIAIINWTGTARTWAMLMGFAIELFVIPPLAEKKNDVIHWHSEHISERYGLFTIIVLGETILSAVLALEAAEGTPSFKTMLLVAGGGLLCAFAFWWLYFGRPNLRAPEATRRVFLWGYTHLVVWASIAAFGAGLAVIAEAIEGHGEASVAIASTVLPGALVLAGLGLVNLFGDGSERTGFARAMLSGAIFMALLGAVVPMEWTAVAVAVVLAFEVAWLVIRFGPPGLERYSTSAAR
jgi:low temperature requirement protein LtrA